MKITKSFIKTLEQVSKINDNLLLKPGNVIEMRDEEKRIVCRAELDVNIPVESPILSTSTLLQVISLFDLDSLDVDFSPAALTLSDKNNQAVYKLFMKSLVNTEPKKTWDEYTNDILGDIEIEFKMEEVDFDYLRNTVRSLRSDHITLMSEGGALKFYVHDADEPDGNSFSIAVEGGEFPDFKYCFKSQDILKLSNGAFNVKVFKRAPVIILERDNMSFMLPSQKKYSKGME